jgi:hypothetical protein
MIKRTFKTQTGTYEEYRVDHVTLREFNRLESDIAKELGQTEPEEEPEVEEPVEDINCLSNDELDIMIMIHSKIKKHNPHIGGIFERELTLAEIAKAERLIQEKLHPIPSQNI